MILGPAILALLGCSALVCAVTLTASISSLSIVTGWNPDDNGQRQLARERRTLLVESILRVVLTCQLVSLVLFVATLERLHPLFKGAMCAVGTLNASRFGFPALSVKLTVFALCGLWLMVHRASVTATSTALVRTKQLFVLVIAGLLTAENILQLRYFADLQPEIITSCCATVFGAEARGVGASLAALPVGPSKAAFFAALVLTLLAGRRFLARDRNPALFSASAVLAGAVSMAALVTWVAPAYYELPTHHCPFCLLSAELGFIGYPLYAFLALAVVSGAGVGLIRGLRRLDPRQSIRPAEERRLCMASMAAFALFSMMSIWPLVASDFRMEGY